jgi:Ca2+-binding RTX toxin-like protein
MAVYQFSSLSDGELIFFTPTTDVLNFDELSISAGDLRISTVPDFGARVRISVVSGPQAGKDVFVDGVTLQHLSINNVTFANGSRLLFGDTTSSTANDNAANALSGTAGSDLIAGFGGNDTMLGGDANDVFFMSSGTAANYGVDSINGGNGFDVLDFTGVGGGPVAANISGTATLSGGGASGGGSATVVGIEGVIGGNFNDTLFGGGANNLLVGGGGNDNLDGSSGNDTLQGGIGADRVRGGAGNDQFVFAEAPGAANADVLVDFVSGADKIVLDLSEFSLGASGNFAAGDSRFFAGPGATTGQDTSDRVIYNTTTGQLFYDPDGNGPSGSQLIATLQGTPSLAATDILAVGQASGTIGTEGNDTLIGTDGPDSIDGRGGNDVIDGRGGNDTLDGGPGVDQLFGGDGNDTMLHNDLNAGGVADTLDGGLGDDLYDLRQDNLFADHRAVLTDAGGLDTVLVNRDFTLPEGLDNLFGFEGEDENNTLIGNAGNNVIQSLHAHSVIDGAGGDDTLSGSPGASGSDRFVFSASLNGDYGRDVIDGGDEEGGEGVDSLDFVGAVGGVTVDLRAGTATGTGISVSFSEIEDAFGSGFDDHLTAHDGRDIGGPLNPFIVGAQLAGRGGNDTLIGGQSADTLDGGEGNDSINAGGGDDIVELGRFGSEENFGNDVIDGGAGVDSIDIVSPRSPVLVDLSAGTVRGGGPGGTGSATLTNIENARVGGSAFSDVPVTDDVIIGNAAANRLESRDGYDTIRGGAGDDTIIMTEVTHRAELPAHAELLGEAGNDVITRADFTDGGQGNLLMSGGAGQDILTGGRAGSVDRFLFAESPVAANADTIFRFATGEDSIELDNAVFTALGAGGRFTAGDARFNSGAGFTSGQDASDRMIYNTTTGQLFYDADGNGSGVAQLVATLQGRPALAPTDIVVVGQGQPAPGPINGTPGNDSLTGTAGDDAISGLGGNDTLTGLAGNDTMLGGDGNDVFGMSSGTAASYGTDAIDGGAGFDVVDFTGVARSGVTANISAATATMSGGGTGGAGSASVVSIEGAIGGGFNDRLIGGGAANRLEGGAGNDNLDGSSGNDTLRGGSGNDSLRGGAGIDQFIFAEAAGTANADQVSDFLSGTDELLFENGALTALGAEGAFGAGDGRFLAGAGLSSGQDSSDRLIYNTSTGQLYYDADGSGAGAGQLVATLTGAPTLAATDITVI